MSATLFSAVRANPEKVRQMLIAFDEKWNRLNRYKISGIHKAVDLCMLIYRTHPVLEWYESRQPTPVLSILLFLNEIEKELYGGDQSERDPHTYTGHDLLFVLAALDLQINFSPRHRDLFQISPRKAQMDIAADRIVDLTVAEDLRTLQMQIDGGICEPDRGGARQKKVHQIITNCVTKLHFQFNYIRLAEKFTLTHKAHRKLKLLEIKNILISQGHTNFEISIARKIAADCGMVCNFKEKKFPPSIRIHPENRTFIEMLAQGESLTEDEAVNRVIADFRRIILLKANTAERTRSQQGPATKDSYLPVYESIARATPIIPPAVHTEQLS